MKTKLYPWLLCVGGFLWLAGCATSDHHSERWEYKVVEEFNYSGQLEPRLNQMARDGWAVISTTSTLLPGTSNPVTQVILRRVVP